MSPSLRKGETTDVSRGVLRGAAERARPRSLRGWLMIATIVGGVVLFGAVMLNIMMTIVIWPGEVKLFAGLICDSAHPDLFIVNDSYNPRPGETITTFATYCVGPRGDAYDAGFWRTELVMVGFHLLVVLALLVVLVGVFKLRKRRGGAPAAPANPLIS